jgi:hypothetical protein
MVEHICTVCHQPSHRHDEECNLGCRHYPALCCQGCRCGSFDEAHREPAAPTADDSTSHIPP